MEIPIKYLELVDELINACCSLNDYLEFTSIENSAELERFKLCLQKTVEYEQLSYELMEANKL